MHFYFINYFIFLFIFFCLSVMRGFNCFYFSYYLPPFYYYTPQQIAGLIYALNF